MLKEITAASTILDILGGREIRSTILPLKIFYLSLLRRAYVYGIVVLSVSNILVDLLLLGVSVGVHLVLLVS